MTKVIIQIPCLNEAQTLHQVIADLPRQLPGVDVVELMVVDDGSTDDTPEVARRLGVHHVVKMGRRFGLAAAFARGLQEAVRRGADIVVNTDGDNQYRGQDVEKLVASMLQSGADMVVGVRDIQNHAEFSFLKKRLQRLGSFVVAWLSGYEIPDATSGFRAYSREAALRLTVHSRFSYTLETLIQAEAKRLLVVHTPIDVNPSTRPSRLFKGMRQYITRSLGTMLRIFTAYYPLRFFSLLGGLLLTAGTGIGLRFLIDYLSGNGSGHVQSLVLAAVLLIVGAHAIITGLNAEVSVANRYLSEELLYYERKRQWCEPVAEPAPRERLRPSA